MTSAITKFMSGLWKHATEQLLHCCTWPCLDLCPPKSFLTLLLCRQVCYFTPLQTLPHGPLCPSGWILAAPGLSHKFLTSSGGFSVCTWIWILITPICIIWQHFRSVFTCWIYMGTFACGSTHSTSHFFFSWCLIVPASWTCYWRLQGWKEGWPWQGLSPILSGMVIENLVKCEKCNKKGWNESQKPDTVLQFSISGTFSNSVEKRML